MRRITAAILGVLCLAGALTIAQTEPFEIYFTNLYPEGSDDSVYHYHEINGLSTLYTRPSHDWLLYFAFAPWDEDLLYYVDSSLDDVYMTDLSSGTQYETVVYIHEDPSDPADSHEQARCLAFDSQGALYVSDFDWPPDGRPEDHLGRIWRVDPAAGPSGATLLWTVTKTDTGWGWWNGHFTVGPDGTIYISEGNLVTSNPASIYSIDFSTGTLVSEFNDNDAHASVCGMAFGPDGLLYYADYNNMAIYKVDLSTGARTLVLDTGTRVMDVGFRDSVRSGCPGCTPCSFASVPLGPIGPLFMPCGASFMGQSLPSDPTNLEIADRNPADGIPELWMSTGKLVIALPSAVECVEITYVHYCGGEFRALDMTGAVVQCEPFAEAQDEIQSVVFAGAGVSFVEIEGCEISIIGVCWHP
jgi:hypothetical protein